METDSTHNQSQPDSLTDQDPDQLRLELQLNEALAAEEFFERASGKLIVEVMTKEINLLLRDITSDKYLKDHMGYVNCLAMLDARKSLLKKLQVAGSPQRKAKIEEKLAGYDNGTE
jgi:predicted NACHT family NTPase